MEISKADQDFHDEMLRIWVSEFRGRGYANIHASPPEFTDKLRKTDRLDF